MTDFNENLFDEASLEKQVISLFKEQGYLYSYGPDLNREAYHEVILLKDLENFLKPRYPELDNIFDIQHIADDIDRENLNSFEFNKKFFQKLQTGIAYKRARDDKLFSLQLIDWQNPESNIFRVVNQFAVLGAKPRRIDIGIYVNGIPLVVWELKSPSKSNEDLMSALVQLKTYNNELPSLFKYNAFSVICDGLNSIKYGIPHDSFNDFKKWKEKSDELNVQNKNLLEITIQGLFKKERLLSIVGDFIWFNDSQPEKRICRYPQYFGAVKMLKSVEANLKPQGSGKGGIYWGTTGCGKSLTMLFLSKLLKKSETLDNPSILLISDRLEINDQLCKLFEISTGYLRDKNVSKIETSSELVDTIKRLRAGGVFLINIQKFREIRGVLSEKNNIVVISDEAHRSQSNFDSEHKIKDGELVSTNPFAKVLHDTLPNATYVGFTATPIDKTMDVFGEVVDKYTMGDSEEDGFTVQLRVETRRDWLLAINRENVAEIERIYTEAREEGASEEYIETDKKQRTDLSSIAGMSSRITNVARDIVNHYQERVKEGLTVKGKAMIVTISRDIAFGYYKEIQKLKPEWFQKEEGSEHDVTKVQLIITRSDKDKEKKDLYGNTMYDLIGNYEHQKDLETAFKDEGSNFKIAIVCDKWLVGFDVPCLDTIYLDRMFKKHNLIQTVSRVNRKFLSKEFGLVVSYWPIIKEWHSALKSVGNYSREDEDLEEVINKTKDSLETLNKLFHDFDKNAFWSCKSEEAQGEQTIQYLLSKDETFITSFESLYKEFVNRYESWANAEISKELERDKSFYKLVWKFWSKHISSKRKPISESKKERIDEKFKDIFLVDEVEHYISGNLPLHSLEYLEQLKKMQLMAARCKDLDRKYFLSLSERLERLMENYNSLWDAQDKLGIEKEKEKLNEVAEEMKEKLREPLYKGLSWKEYAFYCILQEKKDKFEFEFSEEQLIDFSKDVNVLREEISGYIDWKDRTSIIEKLTMKLFKLIDKYNFFDSDENYYVVAKETIETLLEHMEKMELDLDE